MTKNPDSIPLPKEPRHQRFADLVLAGKPLVDAYLEAGFQCTRAAAKPNATKLRRRPDVAAYIEAIQTRAADGAIMDLREILEFCARVKRTSITKLKPESENDANGDLIKSFTIQDTETGRTVRLEKHDPFKAIDTHIKLSGEDPEANALKEFAAVLSTLRNSDPLPTGRL